MIKKLIPIFRLFFILALLLSQVQMALATDRPQPSQPAEMRADTSGGDAEPAPAEIAPDGEATHAVQVAPAGCSVGVNGIVVRNDTTPLPPSVPVGTDWPFGGYTIDNRQKTVGNTIYILVVIVNKSDGCTAPYNSVALTNIRAELTIWGQTGSTPPVVPGGVMPISVPLAFRSATPGTLAVGEAAYFLYPYEIPEDFAGDRLYVHTVGRASPVGNPNVTDTDTDDLTTAKGYTDPGGIEIVGPGIRLATDGFEYIAPLGDVQGNTDTTFTLTIQSTRNVSILSVGFLPDDPNPSTPENEFAAAEVACGDSTSPGTSWVGVDTLTVKDATASCTFTVRSPYWTPLPPSFQVTGTVTASDNVVLTAGHPVTIDVNSETVNVIVPRIQVEKEILDVTRPGDLNFDWQPGDSAAPGDVVSYRVTVTNTSGNGVDLTNLVVIDSLRQTRPNPPGSDILSYGEEAVYEYSYTIKPSDRSPLANRVTATATGVQVATTVSASAAVSLPLITSQLELVVTAPATAQRGDPIQYTATITNAGTTRVQNLQFVTLSPPTLSDGPLPTIPPGFWSGNTTLPPFSWTYTVPLEDDDPTTPPKPDPLITRVRVTGVTENGTVVSADAQVVVDVVNPNLGISVEVLRPVSGALLRGGEAEFLVTVENKTAADLCNVHVVEILRDPDPPYAETVILPSLGSIPNPLPGTTSVEVSSTYLVTDEKDPLQIIFEARADNCATSPVSLLPDRSAATIDISGAQVNAELVADVGSDGFVAVSDTGTADVDFDLNLFNVGTVSLNQLQAQYTVYGATTFVSGVLDLNPTFLDPFAEPAVLSFTRPFGVADVAKSPVLVEVVITGKDDADKDVSITASTTVQVVNVALGISLGLSDPTYAVVEKDTRTFTFSVRNLAIDNNEQTVPLYNLKLYRQMPDGSFQLIASKTDGPLSDRDTVWMGTIPNVLIDPVRSGTFTLTVRVDAEKEDGSDVSATQQIQYDVIPQLEVIKLANKDSVVPGSSVTYTLTVINHSYNQTLFIDSLGDSLFSDIDLNDFAWPVLQDSRRGLAPQNPGAGANSTATMTYPYTVPSEDDRASLVNTFMVAATRSADQGTLEAEDTVTVTLSCPVNVIFNVTNTNDFPQNIPGEMLSWEIELFNLSSGPITINSVEDTLNWNGVVPNISGTIAGYGTMPLPIFEKRIEPQYYGPGESFEDDFMPETVTVYLTQPTDQGDKPRTCVFEPDPKFYLMSPIVGFKEPDKLLAFAGQTVTFDLLLANLADTTDAPWDKYRILSVTDTLTGEPIWLPFDQDESNQFVDAPAGWLEAIDSNLTTGDNPTAPPMITSGVLPTPKPIPYVVKATDPNPLVNKVTVLFEDYAHQQFKVVIEAPPVETMNPLELIKIPINVDTPSRGETITYEFSVHNASTYALRNIRVWDERDGSIDDPMWTAASLQPDQTVVIGQREYTIDENARDPLQNTFSGVATVMVPDPQYPDGVPIESHTIVTVDLEDAKLSIEKTVRDFTSNLPIDPTNDMVRVWMDQPFMYCFTVTNESDAAIDGILVDDESLQPAFGITAENLQGLFTTQVAVLGNGDAENDRLLADQSVEFCTPRLDPRGDLPDPFTNTARVRGQSTPGGELDIVATDKVVIDFRGRDIEITGVANPNIAIIGDVVTYTITIRNVHAVGSNNPITVTNITDGYLGSSDSNPDVMACFTDPGGVIPFDGVLSDNESAVCVYRRQINVNDPDPLITPASVQGSMAVPGGSPIIVQDATRVSIGVSASQLLVRKTAYPTVAYPGDTINYQIAITNIGQTEVWNLTAIDPLYAGEMERTSALKPYQTQFYNYSVTLPGDRNSPYLGDDPFINTVKVTGDVFDEDGTPIDGDPNTAGLQPTITVDASASVDVIQPGLRVTKRAQQLSATRGSSVTYDVTVLNTGDDTITVTLVDDVTGDVQFPLDATHCPDKDSSEAVDTCGFTYSTPTSLYYEDSYDPAIGLLENEEISGTVSVVVDPPENATEFTNVVAVEATLDAATFRDSSSATIDVREEGISVVKQASVTKAPVGGTIRYTVTVTNTGSEKAVIDRLTFYDPAMPGTTITIPNNDLNLTDDGKLESGESFELPAYAYVLKLSDTNPFINQVTVSAHATTGATVIGAAQASVEIQPVQVQVEKIACVGSDVDSDAETQITQASGVPCPKVLSALSADRTVTYYLHISNPGALPIHNITVSDPTADVTAVNTALDGVTLAESGAAGDDIWVMYEVEVPPTATDPYQNVVTVSAQAPIDPENPDVEPLTVYASARASINLVSSDLYLSKSANVTQGIVGTVVTYTLRIENLAAAGGQAINNIQVSDPMNTDPTSDCATLATTLNPGEFDSCTFRHTLALSDPTPLTNTAFAQGIQGTAPDTVTVTDEASVTVAIIRPGGLTVEKIPDQTTAQIGETVGFTYIITNSGSLGLRNLTVTELDPQVVTDNWDTNVPDTLIPGQQVVLRGAREIFITDADPYINTVTASAEATTPTGVQTYTAEASARVFITNSDIVVSNTPLTSFVNVGGTATFTYSVTNIGSTALTNVDFADNGLCSGLPQDQNLGVGATLSFVCNVPNAQLPGPIVSNLYVSAGDDSSIVDSASAQITVLPVTGGMLVTKQASVQFASPGDDVEFMITVRNVGNEALIFDPTTAIDEDYATVGAVKSPLQRGDFFTITVPVTVPNDDQLDNTVTVTATGQTSGQIYTGQATASIGIVTNSAAQLMVTQEVSYVAPVQPEQPGRTSTLVYTFRVRNIGSAAISGAYLFNPHNPVITGFGTDPTDTSGRIAIPTIVPGMTWPITRSVVVPATWADTLLINTAQVRLSNDPMTTPEDEATSSVPVQLFTVTKTPVTTEPTRVGDPVHFTVTITNLSTANGIAATVVDTPSMTNSAGTSYSGAIPITWTPPLPATFNSGPTVLDAMMTVPFFNAATLDNTVTVTAGTDNALQGTANASAPLLRTDIDITDIQVVQPITVGGVTTDLTTIQTGEQALVQYTVNNMGVTRITDLVHTVTLDVPGVTCTPTGPTTLEPYDAAGTTDSGVVSCYFTLPENSATALAAYKTSLVRSVEVSSSGNGQDTPIEAVEDTQSTTFEIVNVQLGVSLQLVIPSGRPGAVPGETGLYYRIRLTNNGASPVGCAATVAVTEVCHLTLSTTDTRLASLLTAAPTTGTSTEPISTQVAGLRLLPGESSPLYETNPFSVATDAVTSTATLVVNQGGYYDPDLGTDNQYYTLHPPMTASATLTILRPTISVAVTASTLNPTPGSTIYFTITVRNTGPVRVENLTGTWYVNRTAADTSQMGGIVLASNTRRQNGGNLTFTPTFLEPGTAVAIATAYRVEDMQRPYTFTAIVNGTGVSSSGFLSQTVMLTITPAVQPTAIPTMPGTPGTPQAPLDPNAVDPIVTKSADVDAAQPGDAVVWTITVRNGGTNPMTNVTISDPVPDTLVVNSATATLGAALVDGQSVTVTTGTLSPGAIVTLTINTTVGDNIVGPAEISNVVCAARAGGTQMCSTDTVAVGADVEGLPATGIHDTPDRSGGHLPALFGIFFSGALMILMSAQVSNRRLVLAGLFLVVALAAVSGAIVLMMSDSGDKDNNKAQNTPVAGLPGGTTTETTPGANVPQGNGGAPTFVFPPTATPYVAPTPAGPRYLMIPKLGDQFQVPIPIVSTPLKDREWDVSGLGYYVGWLEGTTWLDAAWGNTVLAAHVQLGTANPGPFWGLNTLEPGDEIIVMEGEQESRFVVQNVTAVDPSDWTVTAPTHTPTLTLLTCTNWSDSYGVFSERLVVRAVPV